MNYGKLNTLDIANGLGIRVSLFVSGCRNHCPGCFNLVAQDFNYGNPYDNVVEDKIIDGLSKHYIAGLTILGGEPFEPENQKVVKELILKVRSVYGDSKNIWMYTGYVLDKDLIENGKKFKAGTTDIILNNIDVLVDGPFIESMKDLRLKFRGSTNQRVIDMNNWRLNKTIKEIQL